MFPLCDIFSSTDRTVSRECRVEFEYTAQEPDELSLKKGDVIKDVVQKMDGWWEGILNGQRGMFPDNFVKVVTPASTSNSSAPAAVGDSTSSTSDNVNLRKNTTDSVRRLQAVFSYAPEQEDELFLEPGDVIDFVSEVEEGWYRGKLNGRIGMFPSNFVKDYEQPTTNGGCEQVSNVNDKDKRSSVTSKGPAPGVPDVVPMDRTASTEEEQAPELPPKPVREMARCFYPYQAQNEDELTLNEGDIITIISKSCEDDGWWRGEYKGKTGLFPDNFVKLLSPNEPVNSLPVLTASQVKPQQAQARSNISSPEVENKSGFNMVDGVSSISSSKPVSLDKGKSFDSAKNPLPLKTKPKQPVTTTTTPLKSPTSPSIGAGLLARIDSLKGSIKKEREKENNKEDSELDVSGDFNSIGRTEKLNHLTASRPKPNKTRPSSTIIRRENEINGINGSPHPQEQIDSPVHHSTPVNMSHKTPANSINNSVLSTPSTASAMESSSASCNNSLMSPRREREMSPLNTSGGGSAGKPQKPLPWMEELRVKQDRKREKALGESPTSTVNSVNSTMNSTPVQITPQVTPVAKDREPTSPIHTAAVQTRAPPLPAKPSFTSPTAPVTPVDKTPTVTPTPVVSVPPGNVAKAIPPKKLAAVSPGNFLNSSDTITDGTKYVSYEEHSKLKDRVESLEAELEAIKKQLMGLHDRDFKQGHIV